MQLLQVLKRAFRTAFSGDDLEAMSEEASRQQAVRIGLKMNVTTEGQFEQKMREYARKVEAREYFFRK